MSAQLFTRSHYSLLNGLMSVEDIVLSAKERGYSAVALTDYRVMFAALDFYYAAKKHGIKPICGLEVDFDGFSALLIAKNELGLIVLHKLSYKLSKHAFIEFDDIIDQQDDIFIIFPSENSPFEEDLFKEDMNRVNLKILELKSILNEFYIGITHQESNFFRNANAKLVDLAQQNNIEVLATPKVYYKDATDHHAFRALRAIDTQKLINDPSLTFAPDRNFYSVNEVSQHYAETWIRASEKLASQCHVDFERLKTKLPEFINNKDVSNEVFLSTLSNYGLSKRLDGQVTNEYKARLEYELKVINDMGFTNYFLIVYDVIRFAKQKGINVGPGRGSSAGSLIAYSLGITDVDPIAYKLMFERFLNPERETMPDIDIDFPDDRRDEVVAYAVSKYGNNHVAHIIAFGTLRGRQSFRDAGRILNIPTYKINQASKMIKPTGLLDTFNTTKRFSILIETDAPLKECYELALKLEGTPRHVTQHAAGIVMSDKPLLEVAPIYAIDEHINVTQFDMTHLESIGLIKIDFLGIRNLSTIDRISKIVRKTEPEFDITKIPLDDKKTFELIAKGETIGIFQIESLGMTNLIKKMNPKRFLDIVDTIALYRPGPMENIPQYLENRLNPSKIDYYHEDLKPITLDTFGILVYQEQIMEVAQKFAGFTLARADILRRAMSDKNEGKLRSLEKEFLDGAIEKGYNEDLAIFIFNLIFKFANYGFNKSHSVAYGLVSYQQAYLKANYPEYFYTELLSSVIGDENKTKRYIDECQRLNVKLEVPSMNQSQIVYDLDNDLIRLPFTIIKGISRNIAMTIVNERESKGPFKSYIDAIVRLSVRKITIKQFQALIDAGTFDIFGLTRNTMRSSLDEVLLYGNLITIKDDQQNTIFNYQLVSEPTLTQLPNNRKDTLSREFEALGFYLSDYPTKPYKQKYNTEGVYQMKPRSQFYRVIAKVDRIKEHRAKNGSLMAFLMISDDTGSMDAVMFSNVYERFKDTLSVDDIVLIKGNVKEEGSVVIQDFHIFESD